MLLIKMSIDAVTQYIELGVDSWDAVGAGSASWINSSSPTNELILSWPKFFWTTMSADYVGMKIVSAEIPYVWDNVQTGQNTLIYTIGGVPNTITVPVGIYTGAQLATNLQTQISAITAGMTVTYSATTNAFTFTQTISAVAWSLTFTGRQSLYFLTGFLPDSVNSAVGVGSTVISTIFADVSGAHYLYLNSRTLGPLLNFCLTDGSVNAIAGPQIGRIPVNVARNATIFYSNPNSQYFYDFFAGSKFDTFDLYLSLGADQSQVPLDMKGASWSVVFGFAAYREASSNVQIRPGKRGSNLIS